MATSDDRLPRYGAPYNGGNLLPDRTGYEGMGLGEFLRTLGGQVAGGVRNFDAATRAAIYGTPGISDAGAGRGVVNPAPVSPGLPPVAPGASMAGAGRGSVSPAPVIPDASAPSVTPAPMPALAGLPSIVDWDSVRALQKTGNVAELPGGILAAGGLTGSQPGSFQVPWTSSTPAIPPAMPAPSGLGSPQAAFADQYGPAATRAAAKLGVDRDVLLAQWGHETGWGQSVVPGTNNLGNIKDLTGAGTAAVDNATGTTDKYRKFATPDAFADHYADLIARKYPGAVGAGTDMGKFATALKAGGYAEDPAYVAKLQNAYAGFNRAQPGTSQPVASDRSGDVQVIRGVGPGSSTFVTPDLGYSNPISPEMYYGSLAHSGSMADAAMLQRLGLLNTLAPHTVGAQATVDAAGVHAAGGVQQAQIAGQTSRDVEAQKVQAELTKALTTTHKIFALPNMVNGVNMGTIEGYGMWQPDGRGGYSMVPVPQGPTGVPSVGAAPVPPSAEAIRYLKAHPETAPAFKAKYGTLPKD